VWPVCVRPFGGHPRETVFYVTSTAFLSARGMIYWPYLQRFFQKFTWWLHSVDIWNYKELCPSVVKAQVVKDASHLGWDAFRSHSSGGLEQTYMIPVFKQKGGARYSYSFNAFRYTNMYFRMCCVDHKKQDSY